MILDLKAITKALQKTNFPQGYVFQLTGKQLNDLLETDKHNATKTYICTSNGEAKEIEEK